MSAKGIYNYREVNANLATAGIPSPEQLASLGSEGFEAVINLLPADSEYAVKGEKEIVETQGIDYRYIPVDFSAPAENDFVRFTSYMDEVKDKKVLLHCAANYRVSAFYALYAVQNKMWSEEQAQEFVSSVWNPDDYSAWPEFIARVKASTS
ncbi:MAG: protein tyrosine phosphatase family protein [Pseudomonadales bacterium]